MRRLGLGTASQTRYRSDRYSKFSSWDRFRGLPPSLLYAKAGSNSNSSGLCLHTKFSSWATLDRCLNGPQEPFERDLSWTENQVGKYRGPVCHSFVRCGDSTSSSSSVSHSGFERRPRRSSVGYPTHGVLSATSSSTPVAPPHQALELLWLGRSYSRL
jgi:hypothetical protein